MHCPICNLQFAIYNLTSLVAWHLLFEVRAIVSYSLNLCAERLESLFDPLVATINLADVVD